MVIGIFTKKKFFIKTLPIEVGSENIERQATKFSPGNLSLNASLTT